MRNRFVAAVGLMTLATFVAHAAPSAEDVVGHWLTDKGQAKIEIYKKGDKFFGKIGWLQEPNGPDGKPKVDANNPDESKKTGPILGSELLQGFTFDGEGAWTGGTIYDAESGKTYKCTIKVNDEGKLDVRGYIGVPAFGRSTLWTRAEAEAPAAAPVAAPTVDGAAAAPAASPKGQEDRAQERLKKIGTEMKKEQEKKKAEEEKAKTDAKKAEPKKTTPAKEAEKK